MKTYTPGFAERRDRAAEARMAQLDRFNTRPGVSDPAVQARAAERRAVQTARETRTAERAAARQAAAEAALRVTGARAATSWCRRCCRTPTGGPAPRWRPGCGC